MNPTTNETVGLHLPVPISAEGAPSPNVGPVFNGPEQSISIAETAPSLAAATTGMPAYMLPVPTAPLPSLNVSSVASTTNSSNPSVADDADLIEKEWVQKAKQIIAKTQNDPFQQSREISLIKADYMQKRYNKVLKQSE